MFVGLDWYYFVFPLVFSLLDIATGVVGAIVQKNLSSTKMREGLLHKLGFILALAVAATLQVASVYIELGFEIPALSAVAIYIIVVECVSILENLTVIEPSLTNTRFFQLFNGIVHESDNAKPVDK